MFGRGWEDAQATVVAADNLVLEVHTASQPAFRAKATIRMVGMKLRRVVPPNVGDVVDVRFDPKSRQVKVATRPMQP
jgi:hypothetical protein